MTDEHDSLPYIPSGDPVLDQQVQRVCRAVGGRVAHALELSDQFGFGWDTEDDEEGSAEDAETAVAVVTDWAQEVLLRVSAERLDIRLATTRWYGPAFPQLMTRRWKCVALAQLSDTRLRQLVQRAYAARRAEYRTCRFCGESVPVEHRFDADTCHGCASTHLGVVY